MCFDLAFFENLLIWLVVIGAAIALIKLLLAVVVPLIGWPGNIVVGALNILIWAIVAIAMITIVFDLIGCLLGAGVHLPNLHMRR